MTFRARWLDITARSINGLRVERDTAISMIVDELVGLDDVEACFFALGLIDALDRPLLHDTEILN